MSFLFFSFFFVFSRIFRIALETKSDKLGVSRVTRSSNRCSDKAHFVSPFSVFFRRGTLADGSDEKVRSHELLNTHAAFFRINTGPDKSGPVFWAARITAREPRPSFTFSTGISSRLQTARRRLESARDDGQSPGKAVLSEGPFGAGETGGGTEL